jgi:hypothetical protein
VRCLLGKEAALFIPSGKAAQNIRSVPVVRAPRARMPSPSTRSRTRGDGRSRRMRSFSGSTYQRVSSEHRERRSPRLYPWKCIYGPRACSLVGKSWSKACVCFNTFSTAEGTHAARPDLPPPRQFFVQTRFTVLLPIFHSAFIWSDGPAANISRTASAAHRMSA